MRPLELDPDDELDPEELDPLELPLLDPADEDVPLRELPSSRDALPEVLDEVVERVYPWPFTATPRERSSPRMIKTGRV